jgi:hypothetical protein
VSGTSGMNPPCLSVLNQRTKFVGPEVMPSGGGRLDGIQEGK